MRESNRKFRSGLPVRCTGAFNSPRKGTLKMSSAIEQVKNDGRGWKRSSSSEFYDVINPATGEKLAKVPAGTKEDVDAIVRAAAAAYPEWRRTPPEDRIQYLFKLKQILEDQ